MEKPINEQVTSTFQFLKELHTFFSGVISNKKFHAKDLRFLMLMSISIATHKLVYGVITLVEENSPDEADILLRTIVEGFINLKYIFEDESLMRVRAFVVNDHKDRIKTLNKLIRLLKDKKAPGMATVTNVDRYEQLKVQIEAELNEFETQFGKDSLLWPSLAERARLANCSEMYATTYWLLCLDAHMSSRSLDKYLSDQSGQLTFKSKPDEVRVNLCLQSTAICYMALVNEFFERFAISENEEVKQFDERLSILTGQIAK